MKRLFCFVALLSAACDTGAGHFWLQDPAWVKVIPAAGASQPVAPGALSRSSGNQRELPILGGQLGMSRDRTVAFVAEPSIGAVFQVSLANRTLEARYDFDLDDEPMTPVQAADGLVWVPLRGKGALALIDPVARQLLATRAVCPEVRGLTALEGSGVAVACAGGEVVTFTEKSVTRTQVAADLRDVVISQGKLIATTFRRPQVITIGRDDARKLGSQTQFRPMEDGNGGTESETFVPSVAWKTTVTDDGDLVIAHQLRTTRSLPTQTPEQVGLAAPAYGTMGVCAAGVVQSAVSMIHPDGHMWTKVVAGSVPFDIAVSQKLGLAALATAGDQSITMVPLDDGDDVCGPAMRLQLAGIRGVQFGADGELYVYTSVDWAHTTYHRLMAYSPSGGIDWSVSLAFSNATNGAAFDFHRQQPAGVACASCHPEAGDDGQVWLNDGEARRTQSLRGGLLATAPFHWDGQFATVNEVLRETLVHRMGGVMISGEALGSWLDTLPAPKSALVTDVSVGRAAFERAGCDSCHAGAALTNNLSVDVGTGGAFQVPTLRGVSSRLPVMRNGCAKTLTDRLDPACGGAHHGHVENLSAGEQAELVRYLESL